MTSKRILILSFPPMRNDARIIRQIEAFSGEYDIVTCGAGPVPHSDVVEHIELVEGNRAWLRHLQGIALNLKWHQLAYSLMPQVAEARRKLAGRHFDAVFANDLPSAGVAAGVAASDRIHLDLHEYWPGLHDNWERWRKVRQPHYEWMLRKYAAQTAGHSTVNASISDRYQTEYGFASDVVANAGRFREDLKPSTVGQTIRLVHSGGVNPGRRIDVMMRAVAASTNDVSLDLYLMGEGSGPRRELERLAAELGSRITIHPPVEQSELVGVLNQYDAGIHVLAPTCTNNKLALPNKFFDFVQARLAIVTGPTAAMVEVLEKYSLGTVTGGFEQEEITRTINELTPEKVREYKARADASAEALGAERQIPAWKASVNSIIVATGS